MSIEEEARYEDRLEDAISEYERAKAMYDEWWSEEKLDCLEDALAFISAEPLPLKKVGRLWQQEVGDWGVYSNLEKAIKAYKERREYWHEVVEDKASDIACIVPFGKEIELSDGRVITGISEAC